MHAMSLVVIVSEMDQHDVGKFGLNVNDIHRRPARNTQLCLKAGALLGKKDHRRLWWIPLPSGTSLSSVESLSKD